MSDALIETDITYSGRDTNRALGFRRWNASAHASYYTPTVIAETIARAIIDRNTTSTPIVALDPTCGSGRLLLPFKVAGHSVLGIELDEDAVPVAKKNLTSANVRAGDLLAYRHLLKNRPYDEAANVIVANPPFGIWWTVPPLEGWDTVSDHGTVESQAFTIECCTKALAHGGLLVAILPSSTFENGKDRQFRQHLYRKYNIRARITLEHAFQDEYGIDVETDIVVATHVAYRSNHYEESPEPVRHTLDTKALGFAADLYAKLVDALRNLTLPTTKPLDLPQIDLLVQLPIDTNVTITEKGVAGGLAARAMLDFLDASVTAYSPVQGVTTGVIDAFCSPPALIKRGWDAALSQLRHLGFTPDVSKRTADRIDRKRRRYDRLAIPLYPPKPHQFLGYFDDRAYTATANVRAACSVAEDSTVTLDATAPPIPLWTKGMPYRVRPTWTRKKETASETTEYNESKGRDETTRIDIERGYLLLQVETNAGTMPVPEVDEAAVSLFLSAFPLPAVQDVDELLTVEVERNRALLNRQSPYLLDYQHEDVARLLTKPRGYLGWEVGGGKTCSAIAWSKGRGYRRTLVVCESNLIEKWIAECQKFGAEAHRLTTHSSVAALRDRIRRGEKPTGFYITSYEFLSLDGSKTFVPWDCVKFDRDGNVRHEAKNITAETCACGASYQLTVKACPQCTESELWSGQACSGCGFVAYTYNGERRQRPAYKALAKLFPCLIADEAQVAKSKLSLRGQALRSMRPKGCLILTATIFKGYVTDLFWLVSFVLGWNNPLFPYSYNGGSKRFLDCYGTFKFVTREFEDTLHTGKAMLLPEVSSLNLFARLMAPFMVRRVDGEMAVLPPKHRHLHRLTMDPAHGRLYGAWEQWATDRIRGELARNQGADVNMGVISQSLWSMRFAASAPTADDHLRYPDGPKPAALPHGNSWSKLDAVLRLIRDIAAKGEKVIVTSPLRPLVKEIALRLKAARIPFTPILATTKANLRHGIVTEFNHDQTPVLLAAMGCITRGLDIIGANHIIVCAYEWSPETLIQVCGRIHRPGQTRECHEHLLSSADTIDDDMLALCDAKHRALREAIDAEKRYRSVADILERATHAAQLEVARKVAARPSRIQPSVILVPEETLIAVPEPLYVPPFAAHIKQFSLF